jgi:CRISPR-associated protein Csm4
MKLTLKAVSLRFRSSIHLGEREGALEGSGVLPLSDTLFSAFCHGFRLLYGRSELESLLSRFAEGNTPFRLSCAFPSWDKVLYFPVPLNQMPREKDLKKVTWIDQGGWGRLLMGESLEDVVKDTRVRYLPTAVAEGSGEGEDPFFPSRLPWIASEVPRVGLDRLNNHPGDRFFHMTQVHYLPDAHIFFLVRLEEDGFWPRFQATWRLLADEGLGGDRTVGKGLFQTPVFDSVTLELPDDVTAHVLLSLYYPSPEEHKVVQGGFYDFVERKGYVYSPNVQNLRRQGVRFFRMGSVFQTSKEPCGKLVDVTPAIFSEHKVYKYGIALSVPCELAGGSHVD